MITPNFEPPAYLLTEACVTVVGAESVTFTVISVFANVIATQTVSIIITWSLIGHSVIIGAVFVIMQHYLEQFAF